MASATDYRITEINGVPSPCLSHELIVVSVFGLNEEEFADFTLCYEFLCLNKAGSLTANLTGHKLNAGLLCCGNHSLAVFDSLRERLLAKNVVSRLTSGNSVLSVYVVGSSKDNAVETANLEHLVEVEVALVFGHTEIISALLEYFFIVIADSNEFCNVAIISDSSYVSAAETLNAYNGESYLFL